jgi:hypothetical protein
MFVLDPPVSESTTLATTQSNIAPPNGGSSSGDAIVCPNDGFLSGDATVRPSEARADMVAVDPVTSDLSEALDWFSAFVETS